MKRVLIIFTTLMRGGAQFQVLDLVQIMKNSGYEFSIFCIKEPGPLAASFEEVGVKVFAARMRHKFDLSSLRELYRVIKQEKIDIINTQGLGDSLFWGRSIGYMAGVRHFYSTIHSLETEGRDAFNQLNCLLNRITRYYIFVCDIQKELWRKQFRIPTEKTIVIYNGVEIEAPAADSKIDIRSELNLPANTRLVSIIARLHPIKNHRMFIDVANAVSKQVEDVKFLVLGDGDTRQEMEDYSRQLELENTVLFLGHKSNVMDYIAASNIITLTSRMEALPVSLLEAMSQGKPIVATKAGGVPELIWQGENGYTVELNDVDAMSRHVIDILSNPQREEALGNRALELCRENFDIVEKANEFVALLDEA